VTDMYSATAPMNSWKRIILVIMITAACVGCDQTAKTAVRTHLPRDGTVSLAGDTLRLQYTENRGAFLSLGAALSKGWRTLIFTAAAAAVLGTVLAYALFAPSLSRTTVVALSLVGGGGMGNLIDRMTHGGHVVDFMNMGVGGVRTGIFNVADVAITLGAVLLAWHTVRRRHRAVDP
jgi:signal peptidase II